MSNSLSAVHPELIVEWSKQMVLHSALTKSSGGKAAVGMNGRPVLRQGQRARNARSAPGREQSQELTI